MSVTTPPPPPPQAMGEDSSVRILLVSANVGSIFEDPEHMLKIWLKEFLQCVKLLHPCLLALHCQEVGGKNYEDSMQHVNEFVTSLLACEELQTYGRVRVFLDEDFTAAEKFTALGNLYFVHDDIGLADIWDFTDHIFVPVEGKEVLSGNIENITVKEKAKFPQHFYPEFKWSRKGFLRTRWRINGCSFDLVNIHLFHDASNIVAMQSSPSLYSANRQQALNHMLNRFEEDDYEKLPMFIYGDFNFRLDSHLLVQELTSKTVPHHTKGKKDQICKVVYTEDGNGQVVLTVESKAFDYHDKHSEFFYNTNNWLHQFDTELNAFKNRLSEFEITFPPSYPFSEDTTDGLSYMKTRCPSWCDRILLSHTAKDIILQDDAHNKTKYDLIGKEICMGDHKPVFLLFHLKIGSGKLDGFSYPPTRLSRRNTLSINGEDMSDIEIEQLNIHDFAIFEHEQEFTSEFRNNIRHKSNCSPSNSESLPSGLPKFQISFHDIAKQVMCVESVIRKWPRRQRHHSSSSEESSEGSSEFVNRNINAEDNLDQASTTTLLSSDFINIEIPEREGSSENPTFFVPEETSGGGGNHNLDYVQHAPSNVRDMTDDHACVCQHSKKTPFSGVTLAKDNSFRCPCVIL